jgi:hypothetical protein
MLTGRGPLVVAAAQGMGIVGMVAGARLLSAWRARAGHGPSLETTIELPRQQTRSVIDLTDAVVDEAASRS